MIFELLLLLKASLTYITLVPSRFLPGFLRLILLLYLIRVLIAHVLIQILRLCILFVAKFTIMTSLLTCVDDTFLRILNFRFCAIADFVHFAFLGFWTGATFVHFTNFWFGADHTFVRFFNILFGADHTFVHLLKNRLWKSKYYVFIDRLLLICILFFLEFAALFVRESGWNWPWHLLNTLF